MSETPEQYREKLGRINTFAMMTRKPVDEEDRESRRECPNGQDYQTGAAAVAAQVLRDVIKEFETRRASNIPEVLSDTHAKYVIRDFAAARGIDLGETS